MINEKKKKNFKEPLMLLAAEPSIFHIHTISFLAVKFNFLFKISNY